MAVADPGCCTSPEIVLAPIGGGQWALRSVNWQLLELSCSWHCHSWCCWLWKGWGRQCVIWLPGAQGAAEMCFLNILFASGTGVGPGLWRGALATWDVASALSPWGSSRGGAPPRSLAGPCSPFIQSPSVPELPSARGWDQQKGGPASRRGSKSGSGAFQKLKCLWWLMMDHHLQKRIYFILPFSPPLLSFFFFLSFFPEDFIVQE